MSKFWAKLKFEHKEDVANLAAEFLQNFDSENLAEFLRNFNFANYISVKGEEVELEAEFKWLPEYITNAIKNSEVLGLSYGEKQEKYANGGKEQEKNQEEKKEEKKNEDEKKEEKQNEDQQKEGGKEQTVEDPTKKVKSKPKEKQAPKKTTVQVVSTKENINIPELETIAKKASSFEHFAELTAQWLATEKKQNLLKKIILVSAELEKITWGSLESALKSEEIFLTSYDKICVKNFLNEKLQKSSIEVRSFLKATKQYKNYTFKKMEDQTEKEPMQTNVEKQAAKETIQNSGESLEANTACVNIPKQRIKMECMPENVELEEALAEVDKTRPVKERVKKILNAMGLEERAENEQKQFLELVTVAVKTSNIALTSIVDKIDKTEIPKEQVAEVYKSFAEFLNNFVEKYESGKKVKTLTFFSELQKIIMLENEIK